MRLTMLSSLSQYPNLASQWCPLTTKHTTGSSSIQDLHLPLSHPSLSPTLLTASKTAAAANLTWLSALFPPGALTSTKVTTKLLSTRRSTNGLNQLSKSSLSTWSRTTAICGCLLLRRIRWSTLTPEIVADGFLAYLGRYSCETGVSRASKTSVRKGGRGLRGV